VIISDEPASIVAMPTTVEFPMIALFERHMGLSFADVDYKFSRLTVRESQVLERIAAGDDTSEIIQGLDIAYSTLASHRKRLSEKFGICTNGGYAKIFWFYRLCGVFHPEALKTHNHNHDERSDYRLPEAGVTPGSDGSSGAGASGDGTMFDGDDTQPAGAQVTRGS